MKRVISVLLALILAVPMLAATPFTASAEDMHIDENEAARNMYEKIGFHLTGERDGNEIVMEKLLR